MAAIYVLIRNLRKKRTFKERDILSDEMDDDYIISRYGLDRDLIHRVCELVRLDVERKRNHVLCVSLQVLTALRYYATGSFFSL